MYTNNFTMSIAVSPPVSGLVLDNEIKMLKIALLYSDKAKLYSLSTGFLSLLLSFTSLTSKERNDVFESLIDSIIDNPDEAKKFKVIVDNIRLLNDKKHRSSKENLLKLKYEGLIKKAWDTINVNIEKLLEEAGLQNLVKAISQNLIEFHKFDLQGFNTDQIIEDYFEALTLDLIESKNYPFFDITIIDILKSKIDGTNEITKLNDKGKQVSLVSNLIERIPLFEKATLDEILDIRIELQKPLINFRKAMFEFSEEIKYPIWDDNINSEIDRIYYSKIEPSILEIENAINENSYFNNFLDRITDYKTASLPLATSAIGYALTQINNINYLPTIIGTGLGGAQFVSSVVHEHKKKQLDIQKNCMFFYFKAGKILENI